MEPTPFSLSAVRSGAAEREEAVLSLAVDARARAMRAEADLLLAALRWAELHPVSEDTFPAEVPVGGDRAMPLAGEGTPEVAEFAVAELAAALGMTEPAGAKLVGDALELRHRLPLLWGRVQSTDLPAWRARSIAEQTRRLSPRAAAWLDRQVAPFAHKLSSGRVRDLVAAALLRFDVTDPEGVVPGDGRGVEFVPVEGAQVFLRALLDEADGSALESRVDEIAEALEQLGDTDALPIRRSRALGLLAEPQLTLDLLAGEVADPARTPRSGSSLTLYVHVAAESLEQGAGVARVEGRGPVSLDVVREWAGKTPFAVRPVIDLNEQIVVDAYEIPDRLREQALLRDPVCVFPWCGVRSHRRDVDHIVPYETGPPGQTRSDNLAPLCRFHHRLKTHGGWTYRRDQHGIYSWASPRGRTYRVGHDGTVDTTGMPSVQVG